MLTRKQSRSATKEQVRTWVTARVATDGQMRAAMWQRTAEPPEIRDPDDDHGPITVLGRHNNRRPAWTPAGTGVTERR